MTKDTWSVHIDGASRGNPGAAAYALVIDRPGQPRWEEADCLGRTTNNIAEYTALVYALKRCHELGGKNLLIHSDSELLVKQMNGEYKVKNPDLKELYDKAQSLMRHFESVKIRHVYREHNARADALCNDALDGRKVHPPQAELAPAEPESIHDRAVARLREAAEAWAAGGRKAPTPEQVWDELWAIVTASATG
jgi:ribonuclease HI